MAFVVATIGGLIESPMDYPNTPIGDCYRHSRDVTHGPTVVPAKSTGDGLCVDGKSTRRCASVYSSDVVLAYPSCDSIVSLFPYSIVPQHQVVGAKFDAPHAFCLPHWL